MKIKHIYKLFLTIIVFSLAVSCSDDDKDLFLPSHSVIESSKRFDNNAVQVGQEITIADLSQNVVSRSWNVVDTVPGAPVPSYDILKLNKDVENAEALLRILNNVGGQFTPEEVAAARAKFLIGDETSIGSYKDEFLRLSFKRAGVFNVVLTHTFEDFPFIQDSLNVADTKTVSQTVTITVSERLQIVGGVNAFILDFNTGAEPAAASFRLTNEGLDQVEAGSIVRYKFFMTGNPDSVDVNVDGGVVVAGSLSIGDIVDQNGVLGRLVTVDVSYGATGDSNLELQISRAEPETDRTFTFDNSVRVIPSSQPLLITGANINQGIASVVFSREVNGATINESDFDITLRDKNGTVITNTISELNLRSGDATTLEIVFDGATVYDDDVVTINYTKGSLESSDGVLLESVSNIESVFIENDDILNGLGGFEDNFGTIWDVDVNNSGTVSYSTEQVASGSNSLKMEAAAGQRVRASTKTAAGRFDFLSSPSYKVTYKRFIVDGHTATGEKIFHRFPQVQFVSDLWTGVRDQWETIELIYTPGADGDVDALLYIQVNPGEGTVYYDDLVIRPFNPRP